MPRFTDEWVIDRVLFDYVSGGACACCGFQHFLPNSTTADLIAAVSDLDTDAAHQEVAALVHHPWPLELRDQVWADRVRLRQRLKRHCQRYTDFWKLHGTAFVDWCRHDPKGECRENHTRWLQLPRSEVMEFLREEYNIHSAFAVVLCTVLEQVAAFDLTQYPPDGRGAVELNFERIIYFDRRGGFTLNLLSSSDDVDDTDTDAAAAAAAACTTTVSIITTTPRPPRRSWNEENLEIWLERMKSLGGPKLLERGPSTSRRAAATDDGDNDDDDAEQNGGGDADDDDDDADDGPIAQQQQQQSKSSFQSDRRILRLMMARYWANIFQQKYLSSISCRAEPKTT